MPRMTVRSIVGQLSSVSRMRTEQSLPSLFCASNPLHFKELCSTANSKNISTLGGVGELASVPHEKG